MTATGAGQVVTITLAENGASCFLANGSVLDLQILGVTNGPTAGAVQPTVKTSADTTAANATAVTIGRGNHADRPSPSPRPRLRPTPSRPGPSASPRPQPAPSRTGDTVTIAFPNVTSVFTVPASPTVFLTKGFKNCAVGSTATRDDHAVTITLADNGGVCCLPSSTVAQVQILGVTSGIAGHRHRCELDRQDQRRHDCGPTSAPHPSIAAATTPTAVSFASTTLAANARGTWTVGFTSTASGALRTGDTVTIAFPNATSIFTVPASPTVLPDEGLHQLRGRLHRPVATTTVTITLADSGGVCSLPNSTVAQVQILGDHERHRRHRPPPPTGPSRPAPTPPPPASAPARDRCGHHADRGQLRLDDTRRRTHAEPGPSASPRRRPARSRRGDTITVAFPNATSIFTVPATPTVFLTKGFQQLLATAAGSASRR